MKFIKIFVIFFLWMCNGIGGNCQASKRTSRKTHLSEKWTNLWLFWTHSYARILEVDPDHLQHAWETSMQGGSTRFL